MRHTASSKQMHRPSGRHIARLALLLGLAAASSLVGAVLVQPNNYMLDDSQLTQQHDTSGSFSPFYADQTSSSEQAADKDIVSIIGDGLARLRLARMLEQQQQQQDEPSGQLSQEMADLIQEHQQQELAAKSEAGGEQSLSSSVASMLMNAAAAAHSAGPSEEQPGQAGQNSPGQIVELETNQANQNSGSPSKADLKAAGTSQWYNPKEVIPVLKISSMATPSKYKKVYFRSEKKLVDGAFHSTSPSEEQKKPAALANVAKPLGSAVQRRSSRGSSGGAPPSVLQDGVLDFLRKFHDVYVQTRPAGASSSSSLGANLLSAASSPIAALLAPASRPSFASAISTASQMVSSAASVSQAAASGGAAAASQTPASSTATAAATPGGLTAAASGPSKSPLSTQTYVNFWSKTFPTWVRKMLKQMRRRSLHNSSKRQQQQHQHAHGISQKAAASSVASESASAQSHAVGSS